MNKNTHAMEAMEPRTAEAEMLMIIPNVYSDLSYDILEQTSSSSSSFRSSPLTVTSTPPLI